MKETLNLIFWLSVISKLLNLNKKNLKQIWFDQTIIYVYFQLKVLKTNTIWSHSFVYVSNWKYKWFMYISNWKYMYEKLFCNDLININIKEKNMICSFNKWFPNENTKEDALKAPLSNEKSTYSEWKGNSQRVHWN